MFEDIYDNDPGDQQRMEELAYHMAGESYKAEERMVEIYESSDTYNGHNAVKQSATQQQPGRTLVQAVMVLLVLLCVLLLAGIIGTVLYTNHLRTAAKNKLQIQNESWAEDRKLTIVQLSNFCRDGCISFDDSFYHVSTSAKSWEDSRQDCKGRGADLVIVNSFKEQDFINSFTYPVWIGLTDREEEGTWRWVDGSVPNNTGFWSERQPDGRSTENCVNTLWNTQENSWHDAKCTRSYKWICEKGTE